MNKKQKRILLVVALLISMVFLLTGCQRVRKFFKDVETTTIGLSMVVKSYDENSQVIDQYSGRVGNVTRETKLDTESTESSVITFTVGGKEVQHVGSSVIMMEKGLEDIFSEYVKTIDFANRDITVPFLNKMVNDFREPFSGHDKVILIRSQNGTPLATFAGDKVYLDTTDVSKMTKLLVDGKTLIIYRCDYSIYDLDLLEQ
ncbi:DUF5052 family protein [Anaerosphaera multitolerans]|nr:DUF5052 family protein [Anaerosphaera multitolerans]